ncbi:unnamed protein product [Symbiodinium microadriaticum]|nr:unnamed protein product [Symbiodinium microadriaticum]
MSEAFSVGALDVSLLQASVQRLAAAIENSSSEFVLVGSPRFGPGPCPNNTCQVLAEVGLFLRSATDGAHRGEEGRPLSPRDALAAGEGFEDLECPLAMIQCGTAADGADVLVTALLVRELDGKLVLAVPSSAWHRKVQKRTLPKGFMSWVGGAEVAACASLARRDCIEGATIRVWIGLVDPQAEGSISIPDELPEDCIGFGSAASGEDLLPFVPAILADIMDERIRRLEEAVMSLTRGPPAKAAAVVPKARAKKAAAKGPAAPTAEPGLDPSVAAAARTAGVSDAALAEMEGLLRRGRGSRLRAEPQAATLGTALGLDESEGEEELGDEEPGLGDQPGETARMSLPASGSGQAEAFAVAMFRMLEGYHKNSAKGSSTLDRALDGAGGGSGEGSGLPSARRNSAARKALRDALAANPAELSNVIETLMAEDLASASPGVAVPGQTSARAWTEHRSRISSHATVAWASWIIAGALDCLRTDRPQQARARLNIGLLMLDQMSIDHGNWVLSSELALEVPPPFHAYRQHEHQQSGQVYSRLLDPRWAEVAIAHLKDQADFVEKRARLNKGRSGQPHKDNAVDEQEEDPPPKGGGRRPRKTEKAA